jgi:uncharacterized protein YndB with AHSA1/START domain
MSTREGSTAETEALSDREIVSTRLLDAPRELVFRAFSEQEHLAQWWGPEGFTNTFYEFDFKPRGTWRFVMRGPNGHEFENESVFVEIVSPERIVFRHLEPVHGFQMTMLLDEQDGKTHLTWRMLFDDADEYERVKAFVIPANEQNFDRLEAQLAQMV